MRLIRGIIVLAAALASFRGLFAYLDPGSGSLIVQILIAIVVGIAATFRLWKARLLALFGIKREADEDDFAEDSETGDPRKA